MAIYAVCEADKCTGCGTCVQICPHAAIRMCADKEGFLRPDIDKNICIECGLCYKRCPVNTTVSRNQPIRIYSGWSNHENIRLESSSGGAFSEIAKLILAQGGIVFGVAMDANLEAKHIFIETETELSRLRGSKYVQSKIGDAYKQAKDFLRKGRMVLFSGTPCQIAGLKNYLNKEYPNLYTVDLICHGVPSPRVFGDYKSYVEHRIKEKIRFINFRCKKSSWIFYSMGINPHAEKSNTTYSYIGSYYSDPYIRVFLRDNILRLCCYTCTYASVQRTGDFTIADWWGYKASSRADKDFDRKGVSLIMCNTSKAVELASRLDMSLKRRSMKEALSTNLSLQRPFPRPASRKTFWKDYETMSFEEMIPLWMYPETILLSTYMKIYYSKWRIMYSVVNFVERVLRKLHLSNFRIEIQAK